MRTAPVLVAALAAVMIIGIPAWSDAPRGPGRADVRVGAAAAELEADDDMVIGGSILPHKVKGQEGKLRAVAVVIEKPGSGKVVLVACDVLMLARDLLDPVAEEVAKALGTPVAHILINCTHTHHAPSTATLHGYDRDEVFCRRVQRGLLEGCKAA